VTSILNNVCLAEQHLILTSSTMSAIIRSNFAKLVLLVASAGLVVAAPVPPFGSRADDIQGSKMGAHILSALRFLYLTFGFSRCQLSICNYFLGIRRCPDDTFARQLALHS
jgi:hypothetical protein